MSPVGHCLPPTLFHRREVKCTWIFAICIVNTIDNTHCTLHVHANIVNYLVSSSHREGNDELHGVERHGHLVLAPNLAPRRGHLRHVTSSLLTLVSVVSSSVGLLPAPARCVNCVSAARLKPQNLYLLSSHPCSLPPPSLPISSALCDHRLS